MKTRTVINRWDRHGRSVMVQVEYDGIRKDFVQVGQNISLRTDEPEEPTVNWYAMGSVPPRVALAASRALEEAARVAQEMARINDWGRITPPIEGARWTGNGMPPVTIKDGRITVPSEGWEVCDAEG